MTGSLVQKVDSDDMGKVFRLDLYWSAPDHPPIQIELSDGFKVTAHNVSSYKGVRVWEVPALPGSAIEAQLDQVLAKSSTNRLVIFRDGDRQVWRWPSRSTKGGGVISRPARHVHKVGTADPQFEAKLDAIRLPNNVQVDVNELLARVRGAFDVETKNETKRASKLMAQMYAAVEKGYAAGFDPKKRDHEISVSLARVLFLLFGDDTEMWKNASGEPMPDLFQDFIKDHTARDGSDIASRLNALFQALDTSPAGRGGLADELVAFPYVNGGIFEERITLPELDNDFRKAVLDASAVDWSAISPAIFGSMFQSVRDAQTRRELGEHYTSEENILKTLNPLFLDELRSEFEAALARDTRKKQENALNILWSKLGDIRFMDPACGCGNFIIVAYRELRDLELRIMEALQELSGDAQLSVDPTLSLKVTLDHFYGIEIDEWPARIAETAMFLIDRQSDLKMKERFGIAPERLPIQKSAKIVVANALQLSWDQICPPGRTVVVAGNPPFLGDHTRSAEQLHELRQAWGGNKVLSRLDYVTGWHARALRYFTNHAGVWAFVTTNSITQGDQVHRLFSEIFNRGWRIKFAHRTFPWDSEAAGKAAVHCVIIGFTQDQSSKPRLFDYPTPKAAPRELTVDTINAYLVDGVSILVEKRTIPLGTDIPEVVKGSMPTDGGNLVVTPEQYPVVKADAIASRFLRPFIGSRELINGLERWCLWLVDATPAEIRQSPELDRRVHAVREMRQASTAASTRAYRHDHLFRQFGVTSETATLVGIPEVSSENREYLPVGFLLPGTIISNKVYGATDPTGLVFAVASSAMFSVWMRTVGGRMKSDPSFSSTITWNNFPLPPLDSAQQRALASAGQGIRQARDLTPGMTLEEHYDPALMRPEVRAAHRALDSVMDRAFGISDPTPTLLQRQEALFAHYQRLTNAE